MTKNVTNDSNVGTKIMKSALVVSLFVVVSKLLGFVRDAMIASYFGATYLTDAFFFASSMPGIPAVSMSLSTVFLPRYIRKKGEKEDVDMYASNTLCFGVLSAVIISLTAIICAPIITSLFAPGFNDETRETAILFSRVIFCSFFLVMIQYIFTAILNANKVFGKTQLSGVLVNVIYIISMVFGSFYFGIHVLLFASIVGLLVQDIYLWSIAKKHFKFKINFSYNEDIKVLMKMTWPVLLGNAVIQLHEIVDRFIGSLLPYGTISILSYSLTLNNLVKTVIVNAISSVCYPYISECAIEDDKSKFINIVKKTQSAIILVLIPISIITIMCSKDIVSIVYERGNFGSNETKITAMVLLFYAIGFVFSGLREIYAKSLYAINKTKIVTINGAIVVFVNIVLSFALSKIMGISGIALATSVSEMISALLLKCNIKKYSNSGKEDMHFYYKVIIASVLLLVSVYFLNIFLVNFMSIIRFVCITIVGIIFYLICLRLMGVEEIRYLESKIKSKVKK